MAYTDIDDSSEYFQTVLYTGTGNAGHAITGVGFQPDWIWIKNRTATYYHCLSDTNRGITRNVSSNAGDAEVNYSNISAVGSDGFTVGSNELVNKNNQSLVAWNWKCNGGTNASNTDGDITSTVQANTEAGFSIVTYAGNSNSSDQTVGHGLGSTCKLVLQKNLTDAGSSWRVYHESVSAAAGGTLFLNGTSEVDAGDNGGDPARIKSTNASTITLLAYSSGYNAVNASGKNYLAYCFAEKQGYSKFGSYIGNGNANGTFVYTGFKPAWVMIKRTSGSENWVIWDNQRDPFNNFYHVLLANATSAEDTTNAGSGGRYVGDFLSNGFKLRNTHDTSNSSSTYVYMAFAEHPFVSSKGVPTTAR